MNDSGFRIAPTSVIMKKQMEFFEKLIVQKNQKAMTYLAQGKVKHAFEEFCKIEKELNERIR